MLCYKLRAVFQATVHVVQGEGPPSGRCYWHIHARRRHSSATGVPPRLAFRVCCSPSVYRYSYVIVGALRLGLPLGSCALRRRRLLSRWRLWHRGRTESTLASQARSHGGVYTSAIFVTVVCLLFVWLFVGYLVVWLLHSYSISELQIALPSPHCPALHKSHTREGRHCHPHTRVTCGMVAEYRARA